MKKTPLHSIIIGEGAYRVHIFPTNGARLRRWDVHGPDDISRHVAYTWTRRGAIRLARHIWQSVLFA